MKHSMRTLTVLALAASANADPSAIAGPIPNPAPRPLAWNVVSNLDTGAVGELRWALNQACTPGPDDITFAFPMNIVVNTPLPPLCNQTRIFGSTAPGVTIIDGAGIFAGLQLDGAQDCLIEGLEITGFNVAIDVINGAQNNQIGDVVLYGGNDLHGNGAGVRFLGLSTEFNRVVSNDIHNNIFDGLTLLSGASRNIIGGPTAQEKNRIYLNGQHGIWMDGQLVPVEDNMIQGNSIGTDNGVNVLGNGGDGVHMIGALCRLNRLQANVIVDNQYGVMLEVGAHDNHLEANLIGVDPAGTARIGNQQSGVYILGTGGNHVGPGNTISGNLSHGIVIAAGGANANLVFANFVGTDISANFQIQNDGSGIVVRDGAMLNDIYTNVISGNLLSGVEMYGNGPQSNRIADNKIGLNGAGDLPVPNGMHGVHFHSVTTANTVEKNLIGSNMGFGISIENPGSDGHIVLGNRIGVDVTETLARANGQGGIYLGSSNNAIGGTLAGEENVICANAGWGIDAHDPAPSGLKTGNAILNNWIGRTPGGVALGNVMGGVRLGRDLIFNKIGDYTSNPGAGNVIRDNAGPGVFIDSGSAPFPIENLVLTNSISGNGGKGIDLGLNGNNLIPAPFIATATLTAVSGTTLVPVPALIQVFEDSGGQGLVFKGEVVTTTANWSVPGTYNAGMQATATVTGAWGFLAPVHTSEFSGPVAIFPTSVGTPECFCPAGGVCGTNPDSNAGCANSTGVGAQLGGFGSSSVSSDDLSLVLTDLPPSTFGLLFMGPTSVGPVFFGDGLRCVGGGTVGSQSGIWRYPIHNSGSSGSFSDGPGVVSLANSRFGSGGQIAAGHTWRFQGWYRNTGGPCFTGFNTSNALEVTFVP